MGLVKRLLEPTNEMKVRFDCPNCGSEINDEITDTYFSWGDDPGDGAATEETDLECPDCHQTFTLELTAHATGKQIRVINHRDVNVIFHDNTYDSDEAYEDFLDQYEPKDPHAVDPLAYLTVTLTAIVNGHKQSRIEDLLPWNYSTNI